jgi:ankyrin repeat protein
MLDEIVDGRTDLVFEYVASGHPASSTDSEGSPLIRWCAYYGDVSAIKYLITQGESAKALSGYLCTAAFHGHWRLCRFLLDVGEDVNSAGENGETPLHAATCRETVDHERVVKVLIDGGANPKSVTNAGTVTEGFMRDTRNRGETPLHRAAAFATEHTVQLLLDAGAEREAKDVNGDSPLSWASWHLRPISVLKKLCYGSFSLRGH